MSHYQNEVRTENNSTNTNTIHNHFWHQIMKHTKTYRWKSMSWLRTHIHEARAFNFTYRYIDDVLSINNSRFAEFLPLIYPPELEVKETTDTALSASFLDLYLEFDDSGQLSTKIYDKRDDFNFKIINFPNMCSNIPASPAYGVYISQLIRYARASSNYSDFLKRHLHLRNRLLDQGYKKIRLIRSLKKFIFRYQYLVEIYSEIYAEIIISDAFSYSENV